MDDSKTLDIFQPSTRTTARLRAQRQSTTATVSKRSSTVIDSCKSSGHAHGPYTRPHIPSSAQCYRVNGCRGTRAAESGSGARRERRWRSRPCNAPRRAPLPQLPLVAEMPRRMVPSGDAEHSMRARALRTLAPRLLHCPPPRRSTACRWCAARRRRSNFIPRK